MDEEEVYEVEKILQKRKKGKKVEYLVKWKNYDGPDDNTWEPAQSLEAVEIIEQFEKELQEKEEVNLREKKEREREAKELKEKKDLEAKELKEKKKHERETKEIEEKTNEHKEEGKQKAVKQKHDEEIENGLKSEEEEVEGAEQTEHTDNTNETITNGEVQTINKQKEKKKVVKPTKKSKPAPVEEDVYNIEALMEKKGSKYLVKWENFPEDQNTWEPKSSIPDLILKVRLRLPKNVLFTLPKVKSQVTRLHYDYACNWSNVCVGGGCG